MSARARVAGETRAALVAHCDWSMHPGKRWMCVGVPESGRWQVAMPEPVGDVSTLIDRLRARADGDGPLVIGFDFPIGLPAAYGWMTGFSRFRDALLGFGEGGWSEWFEVCGDAGDISVRRPFYPAGPGGRKRCHLLEGLGLGADGILRQCERKTQTRGAACSLFWTLGGNQVGKGAISGWLEFLRPNLDTVSLWPFDGSLDELLARSGTIVAETYPGDAYGQIGIATRPRWSKRTPSGRASVAGPILHWMRLHAEPNRQLEADVAAGFGLRSDGEDRFDALVGLLAMIDVVDGRRAEGCPGSHDVATWEGWILGQGGAAVEAA